MGELNNELKRENQSLRAQIQGLKYENRMYKQLLDNLFMGGNQQTTASLFQGLKLDEQNYEISAKPEETQIEEFTAPGTEIYNVFDDDNEDFEYEEEEEEIDEKELRRKVAKELTEEEKNPQVEDPNLIKSEMIKLFGEEGADEILAMETAMQLRFEKACDASNAV